LGKVESGQTNGKRGEKVKLSRYRHAGFEGRGVQLLLILDLGTRCR
jgi:hypothetical protein